MANFTSTCTILLITQLPSITIVSFFNPIRLSINNFLNCICCYQTLSHVQSCIYDTQINLILHLYYINLCHHFVLKLQINIKSETIIQRLNQNVQIKKLKIITVFISADYQLFNLNLNIEIDTCPVTISLLKKSPEPKSNLFLSRVHKIISCYAILLMQIF